MGLGSPASEDTTLLGSQGPEPAAGSAVSAASRLPLPTSRCLGARRRLCPDVPLPLCCPAAHFASRRPDVPALVLAAPNEVQMCSLAWASAATKEREAPEGGAGLQLDAAGCCGRNAPGRIPTGMRAWDVSA